MTTNTAAGPVGLLERGVREDRHSHRKWTKPRGPVIATPIGGSSRTRHYSLNPHGDTEVLTAPDGTSAATYRYTAYGTLEKEGSTGEDAPAENGDPAEDPLNPLQYQAQWLDGATGAIDAGFRDYDPGLNRFTTRDMYNGALADFGLGADPWNSNRYAFTGGNPISFTDLDGHYITQTSGGTLGDKERSNSYYRSYEQLEGVSAAATESDRPEGSFTDAAAGFVSELAHAAEFFTPAPVSHVQSTLGTSGADQFDRLLTQGGADLDSWAARDGRAVFTLASLIGGGGGAARTVTGRLAGGARTLAPKAAKGPSGLGDLTSAEVRSIQNTVDQADRPLDVVGSAARGERRGPGTDLPIGKGPGTRSDIDYVVPHGSVPFYESTGLYKNLPDIDQIIAGNPNPFIGPSIRFEPFTDPFFIPGAG